MYYNYIENANQPFGSFKKNFVYSIKFRPLEIVQGAKIGIFYNKSKKDTA